MKIRLELDKTLEENAAAYFEKAKKARSKIPGVKNALLETEKLVSTHTKVAEEKKRVVTLKKHSSHWYHKYHWSRTRNGFLLVAGPNASANEAIIKNQALPDDIVFHTDMAGSPFTLLRTEGKDVSEDDLQDAATLTACMSKAWGKGLTTLDVFYVAPEQVTKEAQSGEYLAKGSFMIRGETNYVHPELILGVGVITREGVMPEVFIGSPQACAAHCSGYVRIIPGDKKTSDVAKQLAKRFGGDLDAFVRALPAGGCTFL